MKRGTSGAALIASAPTCFGVQRVLPPDAWQPDAISVLEAMAGLRFDGTALGPPGYLGTGEVLRQRLHECGLRLAEAFLPFHFSRRDLFPDERAAMANTLDDLRDVTTIDARPVAVLSDGFLDPARWGYAGRVRQHPEARLPPERFSMLIGNLHRVAEDCLARGLNPVLHHHAGTFIETEEEIRQVLEAMDSSLIGLCLDTGHACLGGADPVRLLDDYHSLVRHVHLKDARVAVIESASSESLDFSALTMAGAFCQLGTGDANLPKFCSALRTHAYDGWIVVEQDRILLKDAEFDSAIEMQRLSLSFLQSLGLRGKAPLP